MADDITTSGVTAMTDVYLDAASPFVAAAGLVVDEISGARVRGHLDLGPEHHTPWGTVHGGVHTSAVESAAVIGASAAVADRGQYAVGLAHATDLLRASLGGRADLVAEPEYQGRTQQIWVVTVRDEQCRLLSSGRVRLHNVDLEPSSS